VHIISAGACSASDRLSGVTVTSVPDRDSRIELRDGLDDAARLVVVLRVARRSESTYRRVR
jgi:hypothetical protein